MKIIPAQCNECKKKTSVYIKSGDSFYSIPNCKHHGEIKDMKIK